jgi:hypothetical protein
MWVLTRDATCRDINQRKAPGLVFKFKLDFNFKFKIVNLKLSDA